MKPLLPLLLAASLSLSACLTTPPAALPPPEVAKTGYGAFVGLGPRLEERLAEAAAGQLERTHPPHRNLLVFEQRIRGEDGFGQRLMNYLQRDGYFIRQWYDPAMPPQCGEASGVGVDGEAYRAVPVCYLLDSVGEMLRLTLYAAGETWSRLYSAEAGDTLRPLGAWTQHKAR